MIFEQTRQFIEGKVKEVADTNNITIVFQNQPENTSSDFWARCTIINLDSKQMSLGDNPDLRYRFLLEFQIFARANEGLSGSYKIADVFATAFNNKRVGDYVFKMASNYFVGTTSKVWEQINLSTLFYRNIP